ncbi:NTF2- export protein 2 [Dissophora globulifera]|uniref:NTF2-related export protein n=1 Tax=Dissophora globulifera TaxID=979702 RepID=A0A9P6UUH0_9FUNG|nr:NTF2- export protein 2 [Dissophora globulifera]KAG0320230.1 NTF2- export protein 2 [Dissophora globulifera]
MSDPLRAHIEIAATAADQFMNVYYNLHDTKREFLGRLYRDSSAILWNGNAYSGVKPFSEFIEKLPKSEHTVECYDAHPLPTADPNGAASLILNVSGTVQYKNEKSKRVFSQCFVLSMEGTSGTFYIWSDCFRFV